MDDDVQYLGTKLAAPEPEPLDDPCEAHPSVAGVTLHIEKCGEKPAHELTFYHARSGYVNIGRKSGSDDRSMRRENDDHNVVFTCQVVSAKHAKLVFSDSGQVYIVDLHSRHGTHILRRGETTPRMLQAEVETPLADGDVLTFGKVVGAGSYHVSPVTVRVELLTCRLPSEPATHHAFTPFHLLGSLSPSLSRPRKLSSGRYGLISACCVESGSDSPHSSSSISVSSEAASSPSDQDSDIEEQHLCTPTVLRDGQGRAAVKIPAFRSFIRDIYQSTTSHSPCISDVPDEHFEDAPGTTPSADPVRHPSPVVVVIEPFSKSRSHSPMEMATPSPSPPSEIQQSGEPAVIGAWPTSRPESPRHSSLEMETREPEAPPAPELDRPELPSGQTCQARIGPISTDALVELMHRLPPPPPFFPIGGPFSTSIASDFGLPSAPHPPHPPSPPPLPPPRPPFYIYKFVSECVNSEVKASLKIVEDRITALQQTVNGLKSRQTVTEEDVVDLQSHVEILEPESERLLCRITGAERNIATLSTLQGQMATLQKQVTTIRERLDVPEPRTLETPMEDVRACANALNNLVSEMKLLRENAEKQIEARIEVMQSAHAEALDVLKEVAIEAKSSRSSKRKRMDEVEEETSAVITPLDTVKEPITCSPPLIMDENSVSEVSVPHVPVPQVPVSISLPAGEMSPLEVPAVDSPRPKKRARKALYTVAQTAAAMAIGAAATWSALAFS